MSETVMQALAVLQEDKTVYDVLNTVGATATSLTGADFSIEVAIALSVVLKEAEKKIKEITQVKQ